MPRARPSDADQVDDFAAPDVALPECGRSWAQRQLGEHRTKMYIRWPLLLLLAPIDAMRVVVFGGSGFVGVHVCKALASSGCTVVSVSRNGRLSLGPTDLRGNQEPNLRQFRGEPWVDSVEWIQADASEPGAAAQALIGGVDGVVSLIGAGDVLKPSSNGWTGNIWSAESERLYAQNYHPNAAVVAAAKVAGARRFVFVGVASEAEIGFAGSVPGIYTGKRDAAQAAQDAFGDAFVYFGPHLVCRAGDVRLRALDSPWARALMATNEAIGKVASLGEDYTRRCALTPPVTAEDLALGIASTVAGKCEVPESERYAGMTTPSGGVGTKIRIVGRHVDGTGDINALAEAAQKL